MAGVDTGVLAFKLLAERLRDAADGGLQRELYRAVNDAAEPIIKDIRRQIPDYMPHRGGYADALDADLNMSVIRTNKAQPTSATVSIRITARPYETSSNKALRRRRTGRKVGRLDKGLLTHPLFGNREHWFTQGIRPGFASEPFRESQPEVRDQILEAMKRVADKIAGEA